MPESFFFLWLTNCVWLYYKCKLTVEAHVVRSFLIWQTRLNKSSWFIFNLYIYTYMYTWYLLYQHNVDWNLKDKVMTVSGWNDASVFWPCALAHCRSISVELDGYQTVNPWEVLPAENIPGANSTVRPQAVKVY